MVQHGRDSLVQLLIPSFNNSARASANTLFNLLSPLSGKGNGRLSPESACSQTQSPPEEPLPWLWQCHLCRTTYHLSVTRRCLEDGHYFCFAPPSAVSASSLSLLTNSSKQKTRKRSHHSCTSSFDYTGWEAWDDWRRENATAKQESSHGIGKVQSALKTQKDCWTDCSYPSECRHSRLAAAHAATLAIRQSVMSNKLSTAAVTKSSSVHRKRRSKSIEIKNFATLNSLGTPLVSASVQEGSKQINGDNWMNTTLPHRMPYIVEEDDAFDTLPLIFRIDCGA